METSIIRSNNEITTTSIESGSNGIGERSNKNIHEDHDGSTYYRSEKQIGQNTENERISTNNITDESTQISESVILTATTGSCDFIQVEIRDIQLEMLVDSGSACTLLNKNIYDKMSGNKSSLMLCTNKLQAANGSYLEVYGSTNMKMKINEVIFKCNVIICELGSIDAILGTDFLKEKKCIINFDENILGINQLMVPLRHRSSNVKDVRIIEQTSIPAQSAKYVNCYISNSIYSHAVTTDDTIIVIESLDTKHMFHAKFDNTVIQNTSDNIQLLVINELPVSLHLKHKSIIGQAQSANIISIDEYEESTLNHEEANNELLVAAVANQTDSSAINNNISKIIPEHLHRIAQSTENLSDTENKNVIEMLKEYHNVFVGPNDTLGHTNVTKHYIDTGQHKPIRQAPRRIAQARIPIVQKEVDDMLKNNIIEKSQSPWCSPLVIVSKKDGSMRVCVDMRKVNAITHKDAYPLPRIADCLDSLGNAKYFCTLDLKSGYWQVDLAKEDREKTAFAIPGGGLYHFKVMAMGLTNASATFERAMEKVLHGLIKKTCVLYLDDIIVFGKSFSDTLENLTEVFKRLNAANLKLKPSKCQIFKKSVEFLGHTVSEEGISTSNDKIKPVLNWDKPQNKKDVRQFLGFANYYRSFLPNFANIAAPITKLTGNVKFVWDQNCDKAFKEIKKLLTTSPVLGYPTEKDHFILDTDASLYGLGAVLSQVQNGEEKVIAYASKTLSKSQRNYCTTFRELLAVVVFVRHFKYYLLGRAFTVRTDHASLRWLQNFKEPEGMLSRWITILDTYNINIIHRRGVQHQNADGLSRKPRKRCNRIECKNCNPVDPGDEAVHICPILTRSAATKQNPTASTSSDTESMPNEISWLETWSDEDLMDWQNNDTLLKKFKKLLSINQVKPEWSTVVAESREIKCLWFLWKDMTIIKGILYRRHSRLKHLQLVAPKMLQCQILKCLHDSPTAGHFGVSRTYEAITRRFYWPHMKKNIKEWCKKCSVCTPVKGNFPKGRPPLNQEPVGDRMERIAIDIIGPLMETKNNNKYILVIGDYFTKFVESFAIPNHEAITVADKLMTEWISRYGIPNYIHTDQGREFESKLIAELCQLLKCKKSRTTPYRPQSDGFIERMNRTIVALLTMTVNENRNDWDDYLPYIMMAYRATVQSSTGVTPNKMMFGVESNMPIDLMYNTPDKKTPLCSSHYVMWLSRTIAITHELARESLKAAAIRQKRGYDKNVHLNKFQIDQKVWRWYPPSGNLKLGKKWIGPYTVTRKINDLRYEIKATNNQTYIVHVEHLQQFETNEN